MEARNLGVPDGTEARCPECQQAVDGAFLSEGRGAVSGEIEQWGAMLSPCQHRFTWTPGEPGPLLAQVKAGRPTGYAFRWQNPTDGWERVAVTDDTDTST